jgi:hypothetical protein
VPKSDLELPPPHLTSYAPVALRIERFYERFPDGRIITRLVERTANEVIFRAAVYRTARDAHAASTGWAAEREGDGDVNTVACLENTETSAIGRALANLGFTASAHRPSREEMTRVEHARVRAAARRSGQSHALHPPDPSQDRRRHTAADLAVLVRSAERAGLSAHRAALIRHAAQDAAVPHERIARLARGVRRWLVHQVDRQLGGVTTVS